MPRLWVNCRVTCSSDRTPNREDNSEVVINPRTLYTYFGSVVRNFSPNKIYQSMWGSDITKGEALKNTEITRKVLAYLTAQLGKNLNMVLWNAVRNDSGETSKDLFNGFDTITKKELDGKNFLKSWATTRSLRRLPKKMPSIRSKRSAWRLTIC